MVPKLNDSGVLRNVPSESVGDVDDAKLAELGNSRRLSIREMKEEIQAAGLGVNDLLTRADVEARHRVASARLLEASRRRTEAPARPPAEAKAAPRPPDESKATRRPPPDESKASVNSGPAPAPEATRLSVQTDEIRYFRSGDGSVRPPDARRRRGATPHGHHETLAGGSG